MTPTEYVRETDILGSAAYLKKLRKRAPLSHIYINDSYSHLCDVKYKLMMEDYYSYSEHHDPKVIPNKLWDNYCTEFNEAIRGSFVKVTEEIHYFRNNLNRAPDTRDELMAEKKKWRLMSVSNSRYHIYGNEGLFNTKFVSKDGEGKYEGVYNKSGILLTEKNDPINMGTYNYCGSSKNLVLHYIMDMDPFYKYGNLKGYPARAARSIKDFYSNEEARNAYSKIEKEMDED